jgi:hypothetical protein
VVRIDGKEVVLDRTSVTRVSLAVALVDRYTSLVRRNAIEVVLSERPVGRTRVLLREFSLEGRLNPSGYFLFLNIPDGIYTLHVEAEHYLDEEVPLSLPTSPPENPLVTIFLQPRPSYPFPAGATLIRGLAQDTAGKPVADVHVAVVGKNIANRSAENGEFVLYFNSLKEQDVIRVNGKTLVKGNGDQTITVRAEHPNYGTATKTVEVEEGTTAFVSFALISNLG